MSPVEFKGSNAVAKPPAGMDNCVPLPVHRGDDGIVRSVWEISAAELKELIVSRRVMLHVWGGGQPPVALTVVGMKETTVPG